MSRRLLAVPHRTEAFVGACLPACCQMALAFWGISESQAEIAAQIGHIEGAGTPSRNITRLVAFGVEVVWHEEGKVDELRQTITDGKVPVVFLRTGELPYWDQDTPHALVVVGVEADTVYVNDPAFENAPVPVPAGDFELAWDEFGRQWATVGGSSLEGFN
jgi:ABC-type bacteriocin/lantibiotic exporter with double-glycine peptidase domain